MPRNVPRMFVRMPRSKSAGSMSARGARQRAVSRVVERRVKPAERTYGLMDEILHRRGISHVAGDSQSATPDRTNTGSNGVQSLPVACAEYHGRARLCERARGHFSYATPCTRNERNLGGERWLNRVSNHDNPPLVRQPHTGALFFCPSARDRGKRNPVAMIGMGDFSLTRCSGHGKRFII